VLPDVCGTLPVVLVLPVVRGGGVVWRRESAEEKEQQQNPQGVS